MGALPLARRRMDFLLMPNRIRVVIECDGAQHYADDKVLANQRYAHPRRCAEMVAEGGAAAAGGCEVYRFGGHDPHGSGIEQRLDTFFDNLTRR